MAEPFPDPLQEFAFWHWLALPRTAEQWESIPGGLPAGVTEQKARLASNGVREMLAEGQNPAAEWGGWSDVVLLRNRWRRVFDAWRDAS